MQTSLNYIGVQGDESPIFVICVFFVSEGNVLDLKKNIFFSTVNYRRIMHDVGVGWGGVGWVGGGEGGGGRGEGGCIMTAKY